MPFHFPYFYNSYFQNNYNPLPNQHKQQKQQNLNGKANNYTSANFKEAIPFHSNAHESSNFGEFSNAIKSPDTAKAQQVSHAPQASQTSKKDKDCIFEAFGLQLQFDDILLIVLIFFLYTEGVKDEELFLILILLLVT